MQKPVKTIQKDSVDIAKSKSGAFTAKNMARPDFVRKESPLSDSSDKYSDIVFNAARNMSKADLIKKGIMRKITKSGDTITRYNSKGINFERTNYKKP